MQIDTEVEPRLLRLRSLHLGNVVGFGFAGFLGGECAGEEVEQSNDWFDS